MFFKKIFFCMITFLMFTAGLYASADIENQTRRVGVLLEVDEDNRQLVRCLVVRDQRALQGPRYYLIKQMSQQPVSIAFSQEDHPGLTRPTFVAKEIRAGESDLHTRLCAYMLQAAPYPFNPNMPSYWSDRVRAMSHCTVPINIRKSILYALYFLEQNPGAIVRATD